MIITTKQLKQLYALLQEYPNTDHVIIRSEENGSGIGPSQFAYFYDETLFKPKLLGTIEITDVGLW